MATIVQLVRVGKGSILSDLDAVLLDEPIIRERFQLHPGRTAMDASIAVRTSSHAHSLVRDGKRSCRIYGGTKTML